MTGGASFLGLREMAKMRKKAARAATMAGVGVCV
jgi:hypothetical protein